MQRETQVTVFLVTTNLMMDPRPVYRSKLAYHLHAPNIGYVMQTVLVACKKYVHKNSIHHNNFIINASLYTQTQLARPAVVYQTPARRPLDSDL